MQKLLRKNVRSIILTSGTLAPLKPLITELAIPINIRLENPHIIDASQVCVKIISHGPDKEPLLSNYKNRDNPKYMSSMGRTVMSIVQVVPDGVLVFFPSYTMLLKCKEAWQVNATNIFFILNEKFVKLTYYRNWDCGIKFRGIKQFS